MSEYQKKLNLVTDVLRVQSPNTFEFASVNWPEEIVYSTEALMLVLELAFEQGRALQLLRTSQRDFSYSALDNPYHKATN